MLAFNRVPTCIVDNNHYLSTRYGSVETGIKPGSLLVRNKKSVVGSIVEYREIEAQFNPP